MTIPAIPTNLSGTVFSPFRIYLTWDAVSDTDVYFIYRDGVKIGTSASPSFDDTSAVPCVSHSYTVKACNKVGLSAASSAIFKTSHSLEVVIPTNVEITTTDTDVSVEWRSSPGATSYRVERRTHPSMTFLTQAVTTRTSFTQSLPATGQHCYRITAINACDETAASEVCFTVVCETPTAVPYVNVTTQCP